MNISWPRSFKGCRSKAEIREERLTKISFQCTLIDWPILYAGFSNVDLEDQHGNVTLHVKKLECLAVSFSHVLKCRNMLTVTLPCLRKNMTLVQLTHSKKIHDLSGLLAGGSYTTSIKMLREKLPPCPIPLTGDFGSHIDNTQVYTILRITISAMK